MIMEVLIILLGVTLTVLVRISVFFFIVGNLSETKVYFFIKLDLDWIELD